MNFKIAVCTFTAAKYAVENWHYSKVMPAGKLIKFGVWEDEKFIGAVIFGRGANKHIAQEFGLNQTQCVELVRVALKKGHQVTVSRVVAICLKLLRKNNPGIKIIVSYADENQGHHGGIYQAGNWLYLGARDIWLGIRIDGKVHHRRSVSAKYGICSLEFLRTKFKNVEIAKGRPKHKYVYLFDKKLYSKLKIFPYPVRQSSSGSSA